MKTSFKSKLKEEEGIKVVKPKRKGSGLGDAFSINNTMFNIPQTFDEEMYQYSYKLDSHLKDYKTNGFGKAIENYKELLYKSIFKRYSKDILESFNLAWPSNLYIPQNEDSAKYWPFEKAPQNNRYTNSWVSGNNANTESHLDAKLFTFSQLKNENVGNSVSSESGIGISFTPSFTLGVIDFQPEVICTGDLRTMLELFPEIVAAGYVEVNAELILAIWQKIPNGFDLLNYKGFTIATSGRRDQSFGPELQQYQKTFNNSELSTSFVVQKGREYILGIISRISIISALTDSSGRRLPNISNNKLRVWGSMISVIPKINIWVKRIDIA